MTEKTNEVLVNKTEIEALKKVIAELIIKVGHLESDVRDLQNKVSWMQVTQ